MPDNNNTQNNNEQYSTNVNFEKAVEAMKGAYSYLHPDYRRRKLLHLIFVVPMMFMIYAMIYGLILMDLTDNCCLYDCKRLFLPIFPLVV